MSSHWKWCDEVIASHNTEKPFAPENGETLKFHIGDDVVFTNPYGVEFDTRIIGLYQSSPITVQYALGARYLIDTSSPWYPVPETALRHARP